MTELLKRARELVAVLEAMKDNLRSFRIPS